MQSNQATQTTQTTQTPERTLVSMVVDRSGSMESMGREPYNAINSFVKDQAGDSTDVTLLRFDYECDRIIPKMNSKDFSITYEDIEPRGTTSLYQAIGESIDYTKTIKDGYDKIIFMIMTDGAENSSEGRYMSEPGRQLIKEMISQLEKTDKWTFYFLGANIDSSLVGDSLGLAKGQCMDFSPDAEGCSGAMRSCSQAVSRFRTDAPSEFNDAERAVSMGAPIRKSHSAGNSSTMENDINSPMRTNGGQARRH